MRLVRRWKGGAQRCFNQFCELIIREVEWRGNALKRLPYKLRYAAVLCNKDCGITLAKVGGNAPKRVMPWKVSQRWDMCMIRRRSINCLWSECHGWLTKSRMYGSKRRRSRNVPFRLRKYVRMSKNFYYESPCGVTGTAQHTGSEGHLRADMYR